MIVVTAATGKLGQHVIEGLLAKVPAGQIVAAVRNPAKAAGLAAKGVQVRHADYTKPETLGAAFAGATKVLLISSSEVGQRAVQHVNAIAAAKAAGVKHLVYTSILHGDRSRLGLAAEHVTTERAIVASGLPYTFLRNGWYTENYTENLGSALAHGALLGAAKNGRIAAATRADFAAAAVAVLSGGTHEYRAYELGGDAPFTMAELAAEVSRQSGKAIAYNDMPAAQYQAVLESVGVPGPFAAVLADADANIAIGELDETSGDLRRLIGRPTTSLAAAVAAALAG